MFADYVEYLRAGGVLACPTETQLGLLADALQPGAVGKVCALKGRPAEGAPLALLLPSAAALALVAQEVNPLAQALGERYWPGPLTLLVLARPELDPRLVLDGRVGVRVPGPSPALDLVRAFGGPLTATSANRSGRPVARDGEEALRIFGNALQVVPGACTTGLPSTIIDTTGGSARLIRAGAIEVQGTS